MRPKFSTARLLFVTTMVAVATQMYCSHVSIQRLTSEHRARLRAVDEDLVRHQAVLAQMRQVRRRHRELQAAEEDLSYRIDRTATHARLGVGIADPLRSAATETDRELIDFLAICQPIGYRRAAAGVAQMRLLIKRDEAVLKKLEMELEN